MRTAICSIQGLTPLLMHSTKGMLEAEDKKGKGAARKKIPSPEAEAEQACYRDKAGDLYVPCIFFRQAMVTAGKGWKRQGKRVSLSTELKGAIFDPDRPAKLVDPETGEVITAYEIDRRPVVVQNSRIVRSRARVEKWAAEVLIDYDPDIIDTDGIREVLVIAGSRVGVGDYRPEKGGWFGRFEVTEVQDVSA